jgi:hypothetical protein
LHASLKGVQSHSCIDQYFNHEEHKERKDHQGFRAFLVHVYSSKPKAGEHRTWSIKASGLRVLRGLRGKNLLLLSRRFFLPQRTQRSPGIICARSLWMAQQPESGVNDKARPIDASKLPVLCALRGK